MGRKNHPVIMIIFGHLAPRVSIIAESPIIKLPDTPTWEFLFY